MGAPTENNFWELRSKHGRDRIFSTPEILWDAACEYFQYVTDNPLLEHDFVGKDANDVERRKMRAMSIQGLSLYLDVNSKYFYDFETSLKGKEDELSKGFSQIISRIRDIIYSQKFEGAAAGMLNPVIISRDLGLAEKTETKGEISIPDWMQQGIPKPDE